MSKLLGSEKVIILSDPMILKDDGYYVRHKYRAKNGFGGNVVSNQLFHLDFSGNVVDVKDLY